MEHDTMGPDAGEPNALEPVTREPDYGPEV
jgi:hypothetical protein